MDTSKNYFDVEKEFFIMDSEHLEDIRTKLYGFSIQNEGILEDENFSPDKANGMTGCGAYIYIERKDDTVTIKQDCNGSYGIFIFQNGDYFALSNSFYRLIEHVKYLYELSFNRDYANQLLSMGLCSYAYLETMVNEITLLSKNAVVEINIADRKLSIEHIDYEEGKYEINSPEGIAILDDWFRRWTGAIRAIKRKTNNISVALSGGFDSRVTFMLALRSGINLNEIKVNSINDGLHTHSEDYEIASQIAEHFEFGLNHDVSWGRSINFSLEDILNICIYGKLPFHKEMYYKYSKFVDKRYNIPGSGGETIRAYWEMLPQELMDSNIKRANRYPQQCRDEIKESIKKVLGHTYQELTNRCHIQDENSKGLSANIYRYIRCRNHFGTDSVENFLCNCYQLTPLLDPMLAKLKLSDSTCQDNNLLVAFLFSRYCPELLEFKFEGGRFIDKETIKYAQRINQSFPISEELFHISQEDNYDVLVVDEEAANILDKNHKVPNGEPETFLKKVCDSRMFQKSFTKYYDDAIYAFAEKHFKNATFHPMREYYPIIGIVLILNAVKESRSYNIKNPYILLEDYVGTPDDMSTINAYSILNQIRNSITARIDIKITGDENADFEIIELSDSQADNITPAWFQSNGKGHIIRSMSLSLDITIRILSDGDLIIRLLGRDIKDKNNNQVPQWIDYTNFIYNDRTILNTVTPAWHDKVIKYSYPVHAGEIIKFHVEWKPHTDTRNDIDSTDSKPVLARKIFTPKYWIRKIANKFAGI